MLTSEGYKMFRGSGQIRNTQTGKTVRTERGDWLYKPEYDCWYVNGSSYPAECVTVVEDETKAARIKHGRWERVGNYDKWICSECKAENLYAYSYGDDDYELQDFYCPHCGAKMSEGQKDG